MPSFFILAISVVRFKPKRAAAPSSPPFTQPVASRVCRIRDRSDSLSVSWEAVSAFEVLTGRRSRLDITDVAFEGMLKRLLPNEGKGFGSVPLLDRMTARSIKF